jgi:glycosyltransferase involved in cell wall biosynthesis
LYHCNDIIVVPYKHVTQSGPLLIGYNQNKPCITSNLLGFLEYVVEGKSGLIFNNTAEDLASKMQFFIENKTNLMEMSAYIANEMTSRFSMRSLAQSYLDVFKRHIS